MEPEKQDIPRDPGHSQYSTAERGPVSMPDDSLESRGDQYTEPLFEYPVQDMNPQQYPHPPQPPHGPHPQAYVDQYPPPGAGQVSPYQPVPGAFPQKDARMYHQQQPQYPPGTVVYQASGPYYQQGTDPNFQAAGAQLYPGYGTTQQMAMTPGPQGNMGSVTFVNPVLTKGEAPNDYLCLSIFACLCLFCPTGCAAIHFSCQTRDLIKDGNIEEAMISSERTCKFVKISFLMTIIMLAAGLLWKYVVAPQIWPAVSKINAGLYDYY